MRSHDDARDGHPSPRCPRPFWYLRGHLYAHSLRNGAPSQADGSNMWTNWGYIAVQRAALVTTQTWSLVPCHDTVMEVAEPSGSLGVYYMAYSQHAHVESYPLSPWHIFSGEVISSYACLLMESDQVLRGSRENRSCVGAHMWPGDDGAGPHQPFQVALGTSWRKSLQR